MANGKEPEGAIRAQAATDDSAASTVNKEVKAATAVIAISHQPDLPLDPRKTPPKFLKEYFKKSDWLEEVDPVFMTKSHNTRSYKWRHPRPLTKEELNDEIFINFLNSSLNDDNANSPSQRLSDLDVEILSNARVIESKIIPGLSILKNCLPPSVQKTLVRRTLERYMKDPGNKTNLHAHYDLPYPEGNKTLLDMETEAPHFIAKNEHLHRDLTIERVLKKKLRWLTLGGQYDWNKKCYPTGDPPPLPPDLYELAHRLAPSTDPQAAIINFYSPGDTLSLHRDVSEEVDKPLISFSLGCDAIFVIGYLRPRVISAYLDCHVVTLHSGDVLVMQSDARYAWHGIRKVLPETCPAYLRDCFPGHPEWEDYMENKRININIRQMRLSKKDKVLVATRRHRRPCRHLRQNKPKGCSCSKAGISCFTTPLLCCCADLDDEGNEKPKEPPSTTASTGPMYSTVQTDSVEKSILGKTRLRISEIRTAYIHSPH